MSPFPQSLATTILLSVSMDMTTLNARISDIINYLSFCYWLISLSTTSSKVIHVVVSVGCYNRIPQTGLHTRHLFLTGLEPRKSETQCQHSQVLVKALFLDCRVLAISPHGGE